MGEVGLLLVQLLASSCRLLVNVGRMACKLGKKRAQTHAHTTGLTLVHGLSQQVRGPQQPALAQLVGLVHAWNQQMGHPGH